MASTIETAIRGAVTRGVFMLHDFNRKRMAEPESRHPFLTGIHQPMPGELTIEDLPVTGTIPAQLDGRYLRIGPNPVDPDPAGYHWFTGDGMVHGLRIQGGKALWYRNRWTRSGDVSKALGEKPIPSPRGDATTANTNILGFAGRTWALVEAGTAPIELGETLESLAYNPFEGTLKGPFSAHPPPRSADRRAPCDLLRRARPGPCLAYGGHVRGQGPPRGARRGRARPLDPRLRDHRPFRAGLRPARHLLDAGADRRPRLPLSLEPEAPRAHRACCRAKARARTRSGATSIPATSSMPPTPMTCPTGA